MSPTDGPKASSIPIAVKGRSSKMSNGTNDGTNGVPSPPLSPVSGEKPSSPSMPSMSMLQSSTHGVHGLIRALNSLNRYNEAFDSLKTLSKECQEAYKERDAHMSATRRLLDEKDALQKQIDNHSAQIKTIQDESSEAAKKLRDKVDGLEKDTKAKETSLDESTKELQKCKKDLAEIKQKLKEAETCVDAHLKAEKSAIEAHKSVVADMEKLQKSFTADKAKFESTTAELETLKSYYLPTKKMDTAEIGSLLDGIFDSAYNVVYACFSQDLSEDHFHQTENMPNTAWNQFIAGIKTDTPDIPLPASNTPDAKTMRIAAVMCYLGIIASEELFQPVYVCDHGNDFSDILSRVKDPKLAEAARLILLQAIDSGKEADEFDEADEADDDEDDEDDDDKDEVITLSIARAELVVKEVLELVTGLLTPAQKDDFNTELMVWSRKTARIWEDKIQPLEQRIIARSPVEWEKYAGHLSALTLPSTSMPPSSSVMRTGSVSGPRPQMVRRGSFSIGSAGSSSSLTRPMQPPPKAVSAPVAADVSDVSFGIWPVFVLADSDETVVKKGLVTTKVQAQPAAEEIKNASARRRFLRHKDRGKADIRSRQHSTTPSFLDNTLAA